MKKSLTIGLLLAVMTSFSQDKIRLLDSLFSSLYQKEKFNGNVLIAEQGKPIFEKSYGIAEEKTKRPLNVESVFELASVSKQFTAMGIVLLHKKGKLNYDDKISKYIPELAFYEGITVRNLLNHTSGLPDYMELFEEKWDSNQFATNEDIIKLFAKYQPKLEFSPNEKFEYSNTGYALLGSIIERVSKQSFGDFLKSAIFKPLKMSKTLVYRSRFKPQKIDNYALGYVLDSLGNKELLDNRGKTYYTYYLDGVVGDGMVNSTIGDLLKWDRALYTNKLVNDEDKKLIFSGVVTSNGKNTNYGFGWIVPEILKYGKRVNHSGGWAGYVTFIERHLDNDKTIIILQNNATPKTTIPTDEVRKILYNEKIIVERLNPVNLSAEQLAVYTGTYKTPDFPMPIKVFVQNDALFAQAVAEGQKPFKLDAYENHIFKFDEADIRMAFDLENNTLDFKQGKSLNFLFNKE